MANRDIQSGAPSPIPIPPDFPVIWDDEVEPALLWTWDEFHAPLPRSPMMLSVSELTRQGMARAMRETGRYSPGGRRKVINGYPYSASSRRELSEAEKRARQEMIDRAIADARGRWDAEWLPKLEQDLEQMKAVDLGALDDRELLATIGRFLADHSYHWYLHHLVVMPAIEAADRLEKQYSAVMGTQAGAVAHRLLHGAETMTVRSTRALDELAAMAAAYDPIMAALEGASDFGVLKLRLTDFPDGRDWLNRFERYLREFGYRPGAFDFIYPSWIEDPSFVLQNLRARLDRSGSGVQWEEQNARLNGERDSMLAEVRARLGSDAVSLGRFERAYEDAQRLWPLKEDHSHYIDQASTAMVRISLAEVGRRLAKRGAIGQADDVWFITIEEARSALTAAPSGAELGGLVKQRRADHERWSRLRPPKHLGTYPADYEGEQLAPADARSAELTALRGTPASPGEATGIAVIVMSPGDFGKVRPGNVLVCRSTAPMWTPLFGVVAGLISEAGGILSHPAVVAREFGLPAVVGVRSATNLIKDGQLVTVSGSSGLITFGG